MGKMIEENPENGLGARIRAIIDECFMDFEVPEEIICPICEKGKLTAYGRTAAGTQRWKCSCCGTVRTFKGMGSVLRNTKLPYDTWLSFIPHFLACSSCDVVAESLGVTHKTAWFMRTRILEALYKEIPAFRAEGMTVGKMFLSGSFKGTSSAAKIDPETCGERVCVLTGLNEDDEMFYDIACLGNPSEKKIADIVSDDIHSGIIETEKDEVKCTLEKTEKISSLQTSIRSFLKHFHGVSTKWLHIYLAWYKWLTAFGKNNGAVDIQLSSGNYDHTWRAIGRMSYPFRTPTGALA